MREEITIKINVDGSTTIKGNETRGGGSKDVHDLIDQITKALGSKKSEQCLLEPNVEVDPIKKKLYR